MSCEVVSPTTGLIETRAVLREDQSSSDPRVAALLECHRSRTPIGLLAGKAYPLLPYRMEVGYAVLGFYWISAIWVRSADWVSLWLVLTVIVQIEAEKCAPGSKPAPNRDFLSAPASFRDETPAD